MYGYILIFSLLFFSACDFLKDSVTTFNEVQATPVNQTTIKVDSNAIKRKCVIDTYTSQIGVRESGSNKGKEVEAYLKSVGLGGGYPWCAAFVSWTFQQCSVKTSITAWSPTADRPTKRSLFKGEIIKEPKAGEVFTLYYSNLKRIGHTGFYDGRHNDIFYHSVEGNTSGNGSREGDGVYRMKRSYKATHSISDWID